MNNFEQLNTSLDKESLSRDIFDKIKRELDDLILSKINSVMVAIRESEFNLNLPEVNKKINSLSDTIIKKNFSDKSQEDIDNIKNIINRKALKLALEEIAKNDFGGSLGLYENLEKKYIEILSEEGAFLIQNDDNFYCNHDDFSAIKSLTEKLNSKNILDDNRRGVLFEKIKESLSESDIKEAA